MLVEAMVAVLVVPILCVSQGGLEHALSPPMVAVETVAVLVVPVS